MDNLTLITPKGRASYPHLTRPDSFQGKETYNCKLILDASNEDVIKFRAKVDGYLAKARDLAIAEVKEKLEGLNPKAKNPKMKEQYENAAAILDQIENKYRSPLEEEWGDDDTLTGNLILTTKSNASFKFKERDGSVKEVSLEPKIYDATPKLMEVRPEIRGGSELCLEITLVPYLAPTSNIGGGVSCRIKSVQVINLAGAGSSGPCGFQAAEGGFNGEGYVAPVTPPVEDDDEDEMDY